jgi:hypothetical protein
MRGWEGSSGLLRPELSAAGFAMAQNKTHRAIADSLLQATPK